MSTSRALHALLVGVVDYAGLFPPAALSMADAVEQFATYRRGPRAWMLGRFVLSASRIDEFDQAAAPRLPEGAHAPPWRLSGLIGADMEHDVARLLACNARHRGTSSHRLIVDSVECKVTRASEVEAVGQVLGDFRWRYCEAPFGQASDHVGARRTLADIVSALAENGLAAKLRTGGTDAAAIPRCADLAWAIALLASCRVPFKATAGLHHPIRAEHRLTYAPASPRAVVHGFVNVFLAAVAAQALVVAGGDIEATATGIQPLLEEQDAAAFRFERDAVRWRDQMWRTAAIEAARPSFAVSFGSCSFEEPLDDLRALRWLT